ncbi:transketolase family protein [Streptomyces sp. NPDC056716]|uniref:transketolase family protein n=1 Tax=unclassified Streptomyces TaxID=2593676 RepID=UPI0036BA0D2B
MRRPPFATRLKPYGTGLLELAREREEIVCLSGDLTRQCEVDLFREALPERFVQAGMAEAHMMGLAGALARSGHIPYVHTFGVFATRRPYDQIANAIAAPALPVRIIGFMPGVSSPGGPSHQAIDDIALMRALPNMTVIDVADATEAAQIARALVDLPGPAYVRLKRGEVPVLHPDGHRLSLARAHPLTEGEDAAVFASGMMVAPALTAAAALARADVHVSVVQVLAIKPLDALTVRQMVARSRVVVTAENHSVIGGLGSAVAEVMAESGSGRPLHRVGIQDTFAEGSHDARYLFEKYGLSARHLVNTVWEALALPGPPPTVDDDAATGEYAPV